MKSIISLANIKQNLVLTTMLVNGSEQNEQS
jgi:hypothetical protein